MQQLRWMCWLAMLAVGCRQDAVTVTVQAVDSNPQPLPDAPGGLDAGGPDAGCIALAPAPPAAPEAPWHPSPTRVGQPEFLVSGATPGATVKLYYDAVATSYQQCTANQFGQCRVRAIYLASDPPPWIWSNFLEGTHTFTVTQTVCGTESAKSPATTIVFDYSCNNPTITMSYALEMLGGSMDLDSTYQIWGRKGTYFLTTWTPIGTGGAMTGDTNPSPFLAWQWSYSPGALNPFDGNGLYELAIRTQDTAGNVCWSTETDVIVAVPPSQ
jgi:hypothetical protein